MQQVRQRRSSLPKESDLKVRAATSPIAKSKKSTLKCFPRRGCFSRSCCFKAAIATAATLLIVGIALGCIVSSSPKEVDEQWEDAQSYIKWWWATRRGYEPPCTYAGVRHYSWGGAVDQSRSCDCPLRRCLPVSSRSGVPATVEIDRGQVAVSGRRAGDVTVEGLWGVCEAAHRPVTRHESVDPLRVFDAPDGAVAGGIFTNVRSPMCVQSGRVYAAMPPNASAMTITYTLGVRDMFYTNLTDAVLTRGAKYHPITTVPAAGLLFAVVGQAGNLFTLLQEGLRGWAALMEGGFGPGFDSVADRAAWARVPRQVMFLSDPGMDIPQETRHSSEVARQLANAFTVPIEMPYFPIAPISRTRSGETAREPMYCFCGGFVIPSTGIVDTAGAVGEAGYAYIRRTVNEYFGGAPLGESSADNTTEHARTKNSLFTAAVRAAWPARTSASAPRRPRMLWIGRKKARIVDEAVYIAMARTIGFEVLVDTRYVTEASAAEQFYLARYADIVVGFHGVALINAVWMDVTARPRCRTVLEFLPYAKAEQVSRVYGPALASAGVHYDAVEAADAEFTTAAFAAGAERETAKRELMGEGPKGKYVMGHPAFTKHRAVYDAAAVEKQLRELYRMPTACLQ